MPFKIPIYFSIFLFDIPFLYIFKTHICCCGHDSSVHTAVHVALDKAESSWSEAKWPLCQGSDGIADQSKGHFAHSEWCLGEQLRHAHLQTEFEREPSRPKWILWFQLIERIYLLTQCYFVLTSSTCTGPGREMVKALLVRCSLAANEISAKALG